METKEQTIKTKLKIIYNNDMAVIDFLADLRDREPLKALQRFIDFGNNQSICLLYNCPQDNLVVLILYKSPFEFNEGSNKLMLYTHNELQPLISILSTGLMQQMSQANIMLH